MLLKELFEARREPQDNVKPYINVQLKNQLSDTRDQIAGVPNIFANFMGIEKLGINYSPDYETTPLGIYAYPVEWLVNRYYSRKDYDIYASDSPYVNLIKVQGNIVNLTTMTDGQAASYYDAIQRFWGKAIAVNPKHLGDEMVKHIEAAKTEAPVSDLAGGRFWYLTRLVSEDIASATGKKMINVWNILLRNIGIDGAVDNGSKIIHEAEPTQAVFLSKAVITDSTRLRNQYTSHKMQKQTQYGYSRMDRLERVGGKLKTITDPEQAYGILSKHGFDLIGWIRNPDVRQYILKKTPQILGDLKHPTASDYEAAFDGDFTAVMNMGLNLDQRAIAQAVTKTPTPKNLNSVLTYLRSFPYREKSAEYLQMVMVSLKPEYLQQFPRTYRRVVQLAVNMFKQQGQMPDWLSNLAAAHRVTV